MAENNENIENKQSEEIKEELNEERPQEEEKEEIKESLGDKISILHYLENPNISDNIESPRSINSMIQLGFIMDDIRYFTFPEFLDNNPSFRSLPLEIQQKRYEFSEQYRFEKIQKIKEFRDILIEQEKLDKNNNNIDENNKNKDINNIINEEIGSSAINEELRQFERMKRKNEIDLLNAVEYELQRQIMIKEGEAKIRKQNMKIDNFKKQMELKNELEKKQKEEREKRIEEKRKEEEEKLIRENRIKYEKEIKRAKLEEKKEQERIKELIEKQKLQELKRQEFKEKVEKMNEEYNKKIYDKMVYLEERDKIRKDNMKIKRKENINKNNILAMQKKEK